MGDKLDETMRALADAVEDKGVIQVVGDAAREEAARRLRLDPPKTRAGALRLYRRNPKFKWIVDAVADEILRGREPDMDEAERQQRIKELREQMFARCDVPPRDLI